MAAMDRLDVEGSVRVSSHSDRSDESLRAVPEAFVESVPRTVRRRASIVRRMAGRLDLEE
jgi:hypothetical protein